MPALSAEVVNFLTLVKDNLTKGQDRGARASATIGSGANGRVELVVKDPGDAGNSYTVEVVIPPAGGPHALSVGLVGTAITVNLATDGADALVTASNTCVLVAAAINAAVSAVRASFTGTGATSLSAEEGPTTFTGGADPHEDLHAAGSNFMRAQDLATVLKLLQTGANPSLFTATAGSTTTATVASITANAYVGATVTFASNTTTVALRDQTATVKSNTGTVFTFTSTLPAAVANTDTFTVTHNFANTAITSLRNGRTNLADSPLGNHFGDRRVVLDALEQFKYRLSGSSFAARTLSRPSVTTGSGSTTTVIVTRETDMKIDGFKGKILTIGGVKRKIVSNNETSFTVAPAFAAAPAASTAYTVTEDLLDLNPNLNHSVHVGGHPSNHVLADLITQVQTAVEAFTV